MNPFPIFLGYRLPDTLPRRDGAAASTKDPEPFDTIGSDPSTITPSTDAYRDPRAAERRAARANPNAGSRFGPPGEYRFLRGAVEPIVYDEGLHGLTIASTGAGKGRSQIIPTLLKNASQTIVIDPKGENASVTLRARRTMKQRTYVIDPFEKTKRLAKRSKRRSPTEAAINPFDMLKRPGADVENDAKLLAHMIFENSLGGRGGVRASVSNDAFWDNSGRALVTGVILAIVSVLEEKDHHIGTLYNLLHDDDVVYKLATMLDTYGSDEKEEKKPAPPPAAEAKKGAKKEEKNPPNPPADAAKKTDPPKEPEKRRKRIIASGYREIAAVLQMPEITRGGVIATAQSYMKIFASRGVQQSMRRTSFALKDFINGQPMSIFLVLPPDKLKSHNPLLRMWVTMLMKCVLSRESPPKNRTLFLLDEAAQLGHMDDIESAITLGRGYGMQVWTFWQSLAQLQSLYPDSWRAIVDNCGFVSCFGARNHMTRREFADFLGVPVGLVANLGEDEHLLILRGDVVRAWLPDYLSDPAFEGLFDENPFHGPAIQ